MLIQCPDCGVSVSDQASACPQCARPIAARGTIDKPPGNHPSVHTIEQTSKYFKIREAVSTVSVFVGLAILVAGASGQSAFLTNLGWMVIFGGFVSLTVVRIRIWWNHR